VGSRPAV